MINRFVISRIKSSSSDTTDGGSDDLPSEDANTPSMNSQKRKREKTRKYSENYLKFAFTYKEDDGEELAVCLVCSSVLSNKTMKPSKLQRHSDNPCSLERKCNISRLKSFEGQHTLMRQSAKVCELALKASYQVALRVAQTKQPYIIAESLILPTASDMCKTMFGKDEYVKKLKSIPMPALLMNWQLI